MITDCEASLIATPLLLLLLCAGGLSGGYRDAKRSRLAAMHAVTAARAALEQISKALADKDAKCMETEQVSE